MKAEHPHEVTVTVRGAGGTAVRHLEIGGHDDNPERLANELVGRAIQGMLGSRVREIEAAR